MIRLKPISGTLHECPNCRLKLTEKDFLITGMRNLADLQCARCGREFYGDLPSGQGLYTPILLDKTTGQVSDDYNAAWFSEWLSKAYAGRTKEPLGFKTKKNSDIKSKVVLLNCLDTLYGHSLLKLLNAERYLNLPGTSLIVMLPQFLEWMLPAGVAEAWIIDLPLRRGTEWNDWLAAEITSRLEPFTDVFLSVGFSHPHADDFEIEKFTRVQPFALTDWEKKLKSPHVTFIWRDDRLWETREELVFPRLRRKLDSFNIFKKDRSKKQSEKVLEFAEKLRERVPALDFAVAGIGESGGLPNWISDLRVRKIDAATERAWCRRYAESHIVTGVHGSNMLLPSAHAGAVIELLGADRQGNFLQDILFQRSDYREMFFRYRFVPLSVSAAELASLAATILRYEEFRRLMSPEFCRHEETSDVSHWLSAKGPR